MTEIIVDVKARIGIDDAKPSCCAYFVTTVTGQDCEYLAYDGYHYNWVCSLFHDRGKRVILEKAPENTWPPALRCQMCIEAQGEIR
mgnify:CR=1 FL=1